MKTSFDKRLTGIFLTFSLVLLSLIFTHLLAQKQYSPTLDAFQLRMEGKVDSARQLLEDQLLKDPNSPIAWYELHRLMEHIRLGNPARIMDTYESSRCINKALSLEPENPHFIFTKAQLISLDFYIAAMTGADESKVDSLLQITEKWMLKAVQADPDYILSKLTLVELFGMLPPEMGGNKQKAEKWTQELKNHDPVLGMKAKEILLSPEIDRVDYWLKAKEKYPEDLEIREMVGKSYLLYRGDIENARKHFEFVIDKDPSRKTLILDMGRYQMIQAMQNMEKLDSLAPLITVYFEEFLERCPEASNALKAWTISNIAKIKMQSGDQVNGQKYLKKAQELDPHFPKAFMYPRVEFPPHEFKKNINHTYLLRPI